MKLKVVVHEAEEGGYWAEVPAIPGCATQGESFEELLTNFYQAVEGCLAMEPELAESAGGRIIEAAVWIEGLSPEEAAAKLAEIEA